MHVERVLSPMYLRDFADRCRRMATWERDPRMRSLLLTKAGQYEQQARADGAAN